MPAERLSMRRIREVLRLGALSRSSREISQSIGVSKTTALDYLRLARRAGIGWPVPAEMDDAGLERKLFPPLAPTRAARPEPDWRVVHAELRKKHVTLRLLWEEYQAVEPEGYRYSQFCNRYREWAGGISVWMRQEHRGGEKLFIDWAGATIPWVDRETGEIHQAPLFVTAMAASSKIYARATEDAKQAAWNDCHRRAFEFYGGVAHILVPDNPKTAVTKVSRYDPELNREYAALAAHYGTCVIPARPRKPRDKAKVESGVQIAQRWIVAATRNRTFYSVFEINEAIESLLERINARPMRKLRRSRNELFEELDRPHLLPLPEKRYEFADWRVGARVSLDYHAEFEKHFYSVPYGLAHKVVDVRATAMVVEIFYEAKRVASHLRSSVPHQYSTETAHMPKAHQKQAEWRPSRIVSWAEKIGPSAAQLVAAVMAERPHPEQGFRACLGILRLADRFSEAQLEKACARALACRAHSYRSVKSILTNKLENQPLPSKEQGILPLHENVRGADYYN